MMNKPKLSLGDMWLRATPQTPNAEILQKENDRMRGLCKEAADVIAEMKVENDKLKKELNYKWNNGQFASDSEIEKRNYESLKKLHFDVLKSYDALKNENATLKSVNAKLNSEIDQLYKQKKPAPLIPSTAMRFIKKPYIVRESKFGAISESTQYTNILQQWWSETGVRHDTNGEWRNVESVNGI